MAGGEVKVTLIKEADGKGSKQRGTFSPSERTHEEPMSEMSSPIVGKITRYASTAAIATAAWNLAKKSYNRVTTLVHQRRETEEALRSYGGAGFSANTVGDRFDVFGRRVDGESVAYKK